jgi:hypothetical protein
LFIVRRKGGEWYRNGGPTWSGGNDGVGVYGRPLVHGVVPLELQLALVRAQQAVGADEPAGRANLVGVLGEEEVALGLVLPGERDEGGQTVLGGDGPGLDPREALGKVVPGLRQRPQEEHPVQAAHVVGRLAHGGHGGPQRGPGAPERIHGCRDRNPVVGRVEHGVHRVDEGLARCREVQPGGGQGVYRLELVAEHGKQPDHASDRSEGADPGACLNECFFGDVELLAGGFDLARRQAGLGPGQRGLAPLSRGRAPEKVDQGEPADERKRRGQAQTEVATSPPPVSLQR